MEINSGYSYSIGCSFWREGCFQGLIGQVYAKYSRGKWDVSTADEAIQLAVYAKYSRGKWREKLHCQYHCRKRA